MMVIFWDWNGTLLNDVQYAIDVRNKVFPRFGLPVIENMQQYHEQFTFPVRLYYQRAGVSDEQFSEVANAWMDEYVMDCHTVSLFDDAEQALNAFDAAGCRQVIVSASKTETLLGQLNTAGIAHRFDDILGLSHIYATDKTELAKQYLHHHQVNPAQCVMLGDTSHDAEVAKAVGIQCILIARGHMGRQSLIETGCPVCADLSEAVSMALGRNPDIRY